ncbi:MAG: ATP-dependent helicase [Candidatus Gastranaerophilales bacterium]|nr:ATP-dependent helicase [Candidatus Gastranaerophilales bacterium]
MENLTVKKYVLKKVKTDIQYKIDYEKELNPTQLEAVKQKDASILTIAGAGSGKTKTLTYRVARLIESGIKPENILLLTFTKKAADEMLSRAASILDSRCEKVAGGTFHSFANQILRKYSTLLDLKNNFTILDRSDSEDVIAHIRGQIIGKQEKRFPKKHTILDIYSKAINKDMPAEQIIKTEYKQFEHCVDKINEISQEYTQYKRKNSLLDYDDLLLYLKILLTSNENIRKKLSNTYKYILIDEYQDTNTIQAEIIKLLASEHNNVMAVGDDSQSIYSFRGANFKNILDFPKTFENTKIIKLEQNYRSSQNILELANEVIKKAKEKYTKNLFSTIENPIKPALITSSDMQTEAEFITQRILELHEEENLSLNDIAVLARSARMTYNLEIEFAKRNIPYKKFGGLKFIETAHVKDVIAHLRVILNPADIISYNRILLLLDGIGNQTANKLIPLLSNPDTDKSKIYLPSKSSESIKKLIELIAKSQNSIFEPSKIVEQVLAYYEPILTDKYDDFSKRLKDLEHFSYLAAKYTSLEDFLSDLALEPPDSSVVDIEEGSVKDEYLTLSTIHSAKGLEYKAIFIIGAVDGRFPSVFSFNSEDELDEELRLMYVAITRAKTFLYITYPIDMFDYATSMVLSKPSRFFDGINKEVLEHWIIENQD